MFRGILILPAGSKIAQFEPAFFLETNMELEKCFEKASEALLKKDFTMAQFWNAQYDFQKKSLAEKEFLKSRVIKDIQYRQKFRNTLVTAVYETKPTIDNQRIIFIKK